MAEPLAFDPLIIDHVSLTLGGVDYASACDSVILAPTTPKVKFKPVNGRSRTKVAKPDWALTLNLGQDFDKAGLSAQLIDRHGEAVPFTLSPEGESAASQITGTVVLEAGQLGGASATVATTSVTLDVDGQPSFTWRTAAPAK